MFTQRYLCLSYNSTKWYLLILLVQNLLFSIDKISQSFAAQASGESNSDFAF